jgi:hypothetical protein
MRAYKPNSQPFRNDQQADASILADRAIVAYMPVIELSAESTWPRRVERPV